MLVFRRNIIFIVLAMTLFWEATAKISDGEITEKIPVHIQNFELTIPEECEKIGICEDIPNYPYKEVSEVIESLLKLNYTLNKDSKLKSLIPSINEDSVEDEISLCKSSSQIYFPQAARNLDKEWNLILNTEENPQNFFGKQCETAHESCDIVTIPNHDTVCSQKYMGRTMFGLNQELNKVVRMIYDVPSCCSCVGKRRYY